MKTNKLWLLVCSVLFSSVMAMAQNVDPYVDDVYYTRQDAKKDISLQEKAKKERMEARKKMQAEEQARSQREERVYQRMATSSDDAIDAYNGRSSATAKDSLLEMQSAGAANLQSNNQTQNRRVYGTYSDRIRRFHTQNGAFIDGNDVYIATEYGLVNYMDLYPYDDYYYGNSGTSINIYMGDPFYYNSWYPWYSYRSPYYYGYTNWRYNYWGYYDPWYDPWYSGRYYGWGGYYRYPGYYGWGGYYYPGYYGYGGGYGWGYNDGFYDGYYWGSNRSYNYYTRSQTSTMMPRDRYRGNDYNGTTNSVYNNGNGSARSGWNGNYNNGNVQNNSTTVNANGSRGTYNDNGVNYSRRGSWSERESYQHGTLNTRNEVVRTRINTDVNTNERVVTGRWNNSGNNSSVRYNTRGSYNDGGSYQNSTRSVQNSTRSYSEPTRSSSSNSGFSNGSSRGSYSGGGNSSGSSGGGSSRGSYGGRR